MQKIYAKEINYAPATGEFELYLASEVDALINTPHTADFMQAVHLEAAHQRDRWGTNHDAGKTDADWFWLIGYLAGKAIRPDATPEKRLHHIITTAAACLNWHAARTGADTRMRPGIEPPCSAKETRPAPTSRPEHVAAHDCACAECVADEFCTAHKVETSPARWTDEQVEAVERGAEELRKGMVMGKESPCIAGYWFCANCRLCNSDEVHHTSCPTCGGLRPTANRRESL